MCALRNAKPLSVFPCGWRKLLNFNNSVIFLQIFIFCSLCRLQQGKLSSFSYVYGICISGCLSFYGLLSLMATVNVTLGAVISVLGYCMLPMVALSGINVLITIQWVLYYWNAVYWARGIAQKFLWSLMSCLAIWKPCCYLKRNIKTNDFFYLQNLQGTAWHNFNRTLHFMVCH